LKELLRAAFSQFEKNQIAAVDAELLLALQSLIDADRTAKLAAGNS